MDYTADYKLKDIMAQGGAKSNEELMAKIFKSLLDMPVANTNPGLDFGCSAFCVKSPEGDVLVGRNFDYRFVPSANIVVHNLASGARESMCISALPYLDIEKYVAGSLSDGTTDISIPAVASIYCCLDGMNDAGLFIGVLSLRGGGAVQHDPDKSDIMTEDECMDLLNVVHTDLNSEGGEITSNTQWSVVYNLTKKTATVCVDKDYDNKLHFSL